MEKVLSFEIQKGDIDTVVQLSYLLPEFENQYPAKEYIKRLLFALKRGFDIIGFEEMQHYSEHRIILRKFL